MGNGQLVLVHVTVAHAVGNDVSPVAPVFAAVNAKSELALLQGVVTATVPTLGVAGIAGEAAPHTFAVPNVNVFPSAQHIPTDF